MAVKTITKKSLSVEKLSIEELSILYDRIYDIADRLIKKHNPCNICIKNGKIKCAFHRSYRGNNNDRLCCISCKYWNKGCTVKALGCKLFLCQDVKNKVLQKRFRKLRDYGIKYLSFDYYEKGWEGKWNYSIAIKYHASKEDWLKFIEEHNAECNDHQTI